MVTLGVGVVVSLEWYNYASALRPPSWVPPIQLGKESSTQVRSLLRGPTPAHERNAECKLGPRQRAGGGRAQTSPSEDDIRG